MSTTGHPDGQRKLVLGLRRVDALPSGMGGATETASELLSRAVARLGAAGVDSPEIEAELLLEHVTGIRRLRRRIGLAPPVDPSEAQAFTELLEQRSRRIPLQHLLGEAGFLGLRIRVSPDVLIPRPETEQLVLRARERMPAGTEPVHIADLGTGSGCIALAMAATHPGVRVDAFDLSEAALTIARANAIQLGLSDQIAWHHAGVFGSDSRLIDGRRYHLIVTNPPYIPSGEIAGLMPEVRDHDPRLALDGGPDGLAPYRNLATLAQGWLNEGGWLLAEFGDGQSADLRRLFEAHGWDEISIEKDLSGRDRILIVRPAPPRPPRINSGAGA